MNITVISTFLLKLNGFCSISKAGRVSHTDQKLGKFRLLRDFLQLCVDEQLYDVTT